MRGGVRKSIICIMILLFSFPYNLVGKSIDEIDQYQEEDDAGKEIYDEIWYAQSFKPTMGELTKIELKMQYKIPEWMKLLMKIAERNQFLKSFIDYIKKILMSPPDPIYIEIYDNKDGFPYRKLSSENLSINDIPLEKSWIEIDLENIEVEVNNTYFIVVHTVGGTERNCLVWRCSNNDSYVNGSIFISCDSGKNWGILHTQDFCFRTYGKFTGEEPDGKIEHWAIIIGIETYENQEKAWYGDENAIDIKNILCWFGWQESHVKLLIDEEATKYGVIEAIRWLDSKENNDDIVLFMFSGSMDYINGTGIIKLYGIDEELSDYELDQELDKMGSKKMAVILDGSKSGGFAENIARDGRVIMSSCKKDEENHGFLSLENTVFIYYLFQGLAGLANRNRDKVVTAEEAFDYAYPKVVNYPENPRYVQHPQIFDGYPTMEDNIEELPLTYLP